MRRLAWIIPLLLVATVAAAFLWPRGVTVSVTNAGATAMRDVRVDVTGRSYRLGDLPAHASRSVQVNPTGESHLVIRYADGDGASQLVEVGCYFEHNYSGHIDVDVAGGKAVRVDSRVRLPLW